MTSVFPAAYSGTIILSPGLTEPGPAGETYRPTTPHFKPHSPAAESTDG